MPTPLYDVLKTYAAQTPVRFHMPGHTGVFLPAPELEALAKLDLTEIGCTGNLYEPGEPFDSAQQLWAQIFDADHCQFLTGLKRFASFFSSARSAERIFLSLSYLS